MTAGIAAADVQEILSCARPPGRRNRIRIPPPGADSARTVPPWLSVTWRTMDTEPPGGRSPRRARCAPAAGVPVLELAPQESHENPERIGSRSLAVAPYPLQDHVVAEHLLSITQQ